MKVGILLADQLDPDMRPRFVSYESMFIRLLCSCDLGCEYEPYEVFHGFFPESVDFCDAYVITGSRRGAYESETWIDRLKQFVLELADAKKKLLGICFGHQLIAEALGGRVELAPNGWQVGVQTYCVCKSVGWFDPAHRELQLYCFHQDQVYKLPDNAECFASNDGCPNAGYVIGNNILTFQSHPEFERTYIECLIQIRRDRLGRKYEPALSSLDLGVSIQPVTQAIGAFLST